MEKDNRLTSLYADLHIHIGRTQNNLPVKITGSRNLTFAEIIKESSHRKGIQMIGVIDAHSPPVQEEIWQGLQAGIYHEHPHGGIIYQGTTCILGAEIEIKELGKGAVHVLAYFPTLERITHFTQWLKQHMKNVQLSTQRLYTSAKTLQEKVIELDGIFIPAHIFTPFKSVYGAYKRMGELFDLEAITAVELGLSADSKLADHLSELQPFTFVTNSDAHSLPKIGREYNELAIQEASFQELKWALTRQQNRRVLANYGLDPRLGKYYRSPTDGSEKKGVRDRIMDMADQEMKHPSHRPPYICQVPLEFIAHLGKKTLNKLLATFGTEMNILHRAPLSEIAQVANETIAHQIRLAREQRLEVEEGGGGVYGKVRV